MFASFATAGRLQLPHYTLILQVLEPQGVNFEWIYESHPHWPCETSGKTSKSRKSYRTESHWSGSQWVRGG